MKKTTYVYKGWSVKNATYIDDPRPEIVKSHNDFKAGIDLKELF